MLLLLLLILTATSIITTTITTTTTTVLRIYHNFYKKSNVYNGIVPSSPLIPRRSGIIDFCFL